jgi:hypothetical protein
MENWCQAKFSHRERRVNLVPGTLFPENLGEPASVAVAWHQIGMVHEEANRFDAAEQAFRQALEDNQAEAMAAQLAELLNAPGIPSSLKPLIPKLQALLSGSRDPGLAADPDLDFDDAAEILLLLELVRGEG